MPAGSVGRSRRVTSRRTAFRIVAAAFAVTKLGTTLPTPLYPLYQRAMGFSTLTTTVVFAAYVAISVPIVGEGLAAPLVGLRAAGVGFGMAVAVLAAVATASFRPTAPRRTLNVSQLHHNSHEVTREKPCVPSRHTPH
jgi:hypothetical protein